VTALAEVIYDILRGRTSLDDPRITYAELAEQVRDAGEEFEYVHHRNRQLYVALTEVGAERRRLKSPPLPALVVRADTDGPAKPITRASAAVSSIAANASPAGAKTWSP
jgi:hypothetical protein